MQGCKKYLLTPLFLLTVLWSAANADIATKALELAQFQTLIGSSESFEEKQKASESFRLLLMSVLDMEGCFEYDFNELTTVSTIKSPDEKFRIFNWNLPHDDETHEYFCFILHFDKKTNSTHWEELLDSSKRINKIQSKYLKPDQWLGALYYEIIPVKQSKTRTVYTLLGWDGNTRSTTKKIIDAISFDGSKIKLGAPIFKSEKGTTKRFILEYSSDSMVSLRWNKKEKRIIFDHLSPRDPMMTGVYSYYGPDMTYDSFNLEKGKWIFNSDVDVRNGKTDKPYYNPEN